MNTIATDTTIDVPASVATCPDCGGKLTISPDGWEQEEDGWVCTSFTGWCESEPEIEDDGYGEWLDSHSSYDMPYIYWLPVDEKIEVWLRDNYRFVLDGDK